MRLGVVRCYSYSSALGVEMHGLWQTTPRPAIFEIGNNIYILL